MPAGRKDSKGRASCAGQGAGITPGMARCGQSQPMAEQQKLLPAHLISDLLCRSGRFAAQMWDLSAGPLLSLTLHLRQGHSAQGTALEAQDLCLVGGDGLFVLQQDFTPRCCPQIEHHP